jgi:hypothetical protein
MRPLAMVLAGLIGAVTFGAVLLVTNVSADPPPGNDGVCEHANSQQPCRPDPQPDHGQDCESHGQNFDGNEDHCLTEPSASPSASPEPSVSPSVSPSPDPSTTPEASTTPESSTTPETSTTPEEESEVSQLETQSTPGPTEEVGGVQQEIPAALPSAGSGGLAGGSNVGTFAAAGLLMSLGITLAATLRYRRQR